MCFGNILILPQTLPRYTFLLSFFNQDLHLILKIIFKAINQFNLSCTCISSIYGFRAYSKYTAQLLKQYSLSLSLSFSPSLSLSLSLSLWRKRLMHKKTMTQNRLKQLPNLQAEVTLSYSRAKAKQTQFLNGNKYHSQVR